MQDTINNLTNDQWFFPSLVGLGSLILIIFVVRLVMYLNRNNILYMLFILLSPALIYSVIYFWKIEENQASYAWNTTSVIITGIYVFFTYGLCLTESEAATKSKRDE